MKGAAACPPTPTMQSTAKFKGLEPKKIYNLTIVSVIRINYNQALIQRSLTPSQEKQDATQPSQSLHNAFVPTTA